MVRFKDTSIVVDKVRLKARAGLGFDKPIMHWSNSESPHHLVVLQSALALQQIHLFFFKPPKSIDVRYEASIVDVV